MWMFNPKGGACGMVITTTDQIDSMLKKVSAGQITKGEFVDCFRGSQVNLSLVDYMLESVCKKKMSAELFLQFFDFFSKNVEMEPAEMAELTKRLLGQLAKAEGLTMIELLSQHKKRKMGR